MKRSTAWGGTGLAIALMLAGCGSSATTKSTSSAAAASSAAPATASASSSTASSTGSGRYGAAPPTSASSSSTIALLTTKRAAKAGTILAEGPKKLTVYLFEGDSGARSSCSGACASVWPPLLTGTSAKAAGGAVASELGTITRADGSHQVTYHGHPVYLFARDKDAGDAYGQGLKSFGAGWYVLSPRGKKVDKS